MLLPLHPEFAERLFCARIPAELDVGGVLQQVDEAVAWRKSQFDRYKKEPVANEFDN